MDSEGQVQAGVVVTEVPSNQTPINSIPNVADGFSGTNVTSLPVDQSVVPPQSSPLTNDQGSVALETSSGQPASSVALPDNQGQSLAPQVNVMENTVNFAPSTVPSSIPSTVNPVVPNAMPQPEFIPPVPNNTQVEPVINSPISVEAANINSALSIPAVIPSGGQPPVMPSLGIDVVPQSDLKLGAISGTPAGEDLNKEKSGEMVSGLVTGSNVSVAESLNQDNTGNPVSEVKTVNAPHPLADLYTNLEKMAANSQMVVEQEIEAERHHKSLEQMKDDQLGWQITGRVTQVLMVFSWVLAIFSLFFPWIVKLPKNERGLSIDFILFVVTIMVLLTGTILSFWVNLHQVIKLITWFIFALFVIIFIIISLHSGGVIKGDYPLLNLFLNRFSF